MKKLLKTSKQWLLFHYERFLDSRRYLASCHWIGSESNHGRIHLLSDIIQKYHVVEKALSMPGFRERPGIETVKSLIADLNQWEESFGGTGEDEKQICAAYSALEAYRKRHGAMGVEVADIFGDFDPQLKASETGGGTVPFVKSEQLDWSQLKPFLLARASLRSFDAARIPDLALIREGAEIAIKAPSVCNRQTGRLHVYYGETIAQLLKYQPGNRGFGHTLPCLLVVTSDMRYFNARHERNQPFIDGGLFAMQTLLALQSLGLGTICLNWCVSPQADREARKIGAIPDHEQLIFLIGVGYPTDDARSPVSHRRTHDEILTVHFADQTANPSGTTPS